MKQRLQALLAELRRRRPIVDHAFQAAARNRSEYGGRLVSVITLPGFLAFFPLLALAFSVAGFIAAYDSSAQDQVVKALSKVLPGLVGSGKGQLDVQSLASSKAAAGVIGLVGLAFSGLGLISALRTATRAMWRLPENAGNFVVAKVRDLGVLVVMGLALVLSFALTGGATAAAKTIVHHSPLPDSGVGTVLLQVAAIVVAVAGDVLLFGVAYRVLPQTKATWREVGDGALLAAIGFEVLKTFGAFYLKRTTGNAVYGTFAAVIGLLVWVNLVARLYVFAAAWAVTAPYQPDTSPSGTATASPGVPALPVLDRPAAPAGDPAWARRGARWGTAVLGGAAGVLVVAAAGAARSVLPRRS